VCLSGPLRGIVASPSTGYAPAGGAHSRTQFRAKLLSGCLRQGVVMCIPPYPSGLSSLTTPNTRHRSEVSSITLAAINTQPSCASCRASRRSPCSYTWGSATARSAGASPAAARRGTAPVRVCTSVLAPLRPPVVTTCFDANCMFGCHHGATTQHSSTSRTRKPSQHTRLLFVQAHGAPRRYAFGPLRAHGARNQRAGAYPSRIRYSYSVCASTRQVQTHKLRAYPPVAETTIDTDLP